MTANDAEQGHTARGARDGDGRERDGRSEKVTWERERERETENAAEGASGNDAVGAPTASH